MRAPRPPAAEPVREIFYLLRKLHLIENIRQVRPPHLLLSRSQHYAESNPFRPPSSSSGEERERLYNSQARQMPVFTDYQKKTTRQIPVVVLERIG